MSRRIAAVIAAALVAVVVNFLGVVFFFRPIAEADSVSGSLPSPVVGFLVYGGSAEIDRQKQRR